MTIVTKWNHIMGIKRRGVKRWEWNWLKVPLSLDMSGASKGFEKGQCNVNFYSLFILTYPDLSYGWCWRYVTYHWAMVIRLGQSPARQLGQITQSVDIVHGVKDIVTRPWPPPLPLQHLHLLEDTRGELLQAGGPGRHGHVSHGDPEQSLNRCHGFRLK